MKGAKKPAMPKIQAAPPVQAATAPLRPQPAELWNRERTAEFLGISVSSVRRIEDSGELPPTIDEKGRHLHSVEQLREYKLRAHAKNIPTSPEVDPITAAAAFALFDQGNGPADAVQKVPCTPRTACELHREWASMRNSFVIEGDCVTKLEELGTYFGTEIKTGADLARLIAATISNTSCRLCGDEAGSYCSQCCVHRGTKVFALAESALSENAAFWERYKVERSHAELARRANVRVRAAAATAQGPSGVRPGADPVVGDGYLGAEDESGSS